VVDLPYANPAGRLWHFYDEVVAAVGSTPNQPVSVILGRVWELGVRPDAGELSRRMALVFDLLNQVQKQVTAAGDADEVEHNLEHFGSWEAAVLALTRFYVPVHSADVNLGASLGAAQMSGLRGCALALRRAGRREPDPVDPRVKAARDQVAELLNSVEILDGFPVELREYVAGQLRRVLATLDDAPLAGMGPVQRVVDETVTGLFRVATVSGDEVREQTKRDSSDSTTSLGKLLAALTALNVVCTLVMNAPKVIDTMQAVGELTQGLAR
jgi:hypothetical protein